MQTLKTISTIGKHQDDGVEELCAEIVRVAYEDFKKYLRILDKTNSEKIRCKYEIEVRQIIKFFKSEWYSDICKIDRNIMLGALVEELNKHTGNKEFVEEMIKECDVK